MPLLWLLELLVPLVYEEEFPADELPDDTAGLLYAGLESVLPAGLVCTAWLPEDAAELCLVTILLACDAVPDDFDAVTLLREMLLPPSVPRPVLLLVPMPLLTVVFPDPANTRSSFCVS